MKPLDAALAYAARGWRVFPCIPHGPRRKQPMTPNGFQDASADPSVVADWWHRWPDALIGVATGPAGGFVVLDVDIKFPDRNGFDTLDALGFAVLPETPMVHTASGGLHLYFRLPDNLEIRNTQGAEGRGIGPGLDWRGRGGYVIVPSPGSGYEWDRHCHLDTTALAPIPTALLPREPQRQSLARPIRPSTGLSRYASEALNSACRRIVAAPDGQQEATLNSEAFAIGTLAGAGAVPQDFARGVLLYVARQIPDYDPRRPWFPAEIEKKVNCAFDAGMRHPRKVHRA